MKSLLLDLAFLKNILDKPNIPDSLVETTVKDFSENCEIVHVSYILEYIGQDRNTCFFSVRFSTIKSGELTRIVLYECTHI